MEIILVDHKISKGKDVNLVTNDRILLQKQKL